MLREVSHTGRELLSDVTYPRTLRKLDPRSGGGSRAGGRREARQRPSLRLREERVLGCQLQPGDCGS